jgi:hypothetical protein
MEYPSEKKNDGNFASCATRNDAVSRHFFSGWILPSTNKKINSFLKLVGCTCRLVFFRLVDFLFCRLFGAKRRQLSFCRLFVLVSFRGRQNAKQIDDKLGR